MEKYSLPMLAYVVVNRSELAGVTVFKMWREQTVTEIHKVSLKSFEWFQRLACRCRDMIFYDFAPMLFAVA